MEVIIVEKPEQVAQRAASIIIQTIERKPDAVLGLATGSTPVATYEELIRRHKAGEVSFAEVSTVNLDEYVGIPATHPQSYRTFMNEKLFNHINIPPSRTNVPDGMMDNPMVAGPAYEQTIHNLGGIDLQLLGIGANGHIGFNEPTSSLASRTRLKTLTRRTIEDNSRFFEKGEFQPSMAITMGIQTIMEARRVILLAVGESKARAVADMIEGPLSAMCPASALQMHPKTSVLIDQAAASELQMNDYYNWVLSRQDELTKRFGDPR